MDKVVSWNSCLLSHVGRMVLIKHVLSSIPIHLLASAVMPKGVTRLIERVCATFLWGSREGSSKFHWIGWRDLCFPWEERG